MSADNGLVVRRMRDSTSYGVFHYFCSNDFELDAPDSKTARRIYSDPIAAIIGAHFIQAVEHTEYGVYVPKEVLDACINFLKLAARFK